MPDYTVKVNESAETSQCALTVFGPGEGEQVLRIRWTRTRDGFHTWKALGPAADRFSDEQVFDLIEAANRCFDDPSRREALERRVNDIMQGD